MGRGEGLTGGVGGDVGEAFRVDGGGDGSVKVDVAVWEEQTRWKGPYPLQLFVGVGADCLISGDCMDRYVGGC